MTSTPVDDGVVKPYTSPSSPATPAAIVSGLFLIRTRSPKLGMFLTSVPLLPNELRSMRQAISRRIDRALNFSAS